MPTHSSKKHNYLKYGYFLLGLPVFFILRYYYTNDPEVASGEGFFPRCIFNLATGFHCPGCGSQRAAHDLLHFRIGEALKHNIVIVLIAIIILSKVYAFLSKKYVPKFHYNLPHKPYFIYTVISVICIYWILRNIPYEPFTYLAP